MFLQVFIAFVLALKSYRLLTLMTPQWYSDPRILFAQTFYHPVNSNPQPTPTTLICAFCFGTCVPLRDQCDSHEFCTQWSDDVIRQIISHWPPTTLAVYLTICCWYFLLEFVSVLALRLFRSPMTFNFATQICTQKISDLGTKIFRMSISDLPPEILLEIATRLGTTKNLANFKMTCIRIYNAIESEKKFHRKRLPHLKIEAIKFHYKKAGEIRVLYRKKHEELFSYKAKAWKYSTPFSIKLHILTKHWILEDDCLVKFWGDSILDIELLKCLLEIEYGNGIRCYFNHSYSDNLNTAKVLEARPFIRELLQKVDCLSAKNIFIFSWNCVEKNALYMYVFLK